ncbi:competence protein ComEC [Haloarcula vallismortis]|uniref:Competence-like protein n=2 Tax=Haloarcula vallismortis TaxID=28442 RepID=M0J6Y3_HALVA|nr:lamin tail domain-containing protein [Haloarcula vallismortis]EMA03759.1 competence-like protein [Haloarcula vallismortis ATCC 29715]SDW32479.1 competence protein ComEC [Haloarcula vallismortis]
MVQSREVASVTIAVLLVLAGCGGFVANGVDSSANQRTATETTTPEAPSPAAANGTLEVHFINVGQSVATLLVSPDNETMLIDSGDFTDDGEYVLQYLDRQDIDRIDHFVVSHNDADHIGGNAAVIRHYETEKNGVGAVYDPGIAASTQTYERYLDAVDAYNVTLYETREGDRIRFAGVETTVLGPPEPYLENAARNENSIVLRIEHGETSFLFTGDAEDDQEAYLVETYGSGLRSTVLKAGHHGSASSTSGSLLNATDPRTVVVSSAYDSQYGHPSNETLGRLAARSVPAYWTATHGDTVLTSNGTAVTVSTQRAAPTAPLSLRSGNPIAPGTTEPVQPRAIYFDRSSPRTDTPVATETPSVTDGGTPTENTSGDLIIDRVRADAAGDDRDNLNDEYVVFRNAGAEPLEMGGWTVADEAGHTYTVPDGFTLEPDATVTLHTGSGTDTDTDLYWGSGRPIWNNGGDTITVTDTDNETVLKRSY